MPDETPDRKELGFYFGLAQVGTELAAMIVIGVLLDRSFGWTPWATVTGFVFGSVGSFVHLLVMLKRHEQQNQRRPPDAQP